MCGISGAYLSNGNETTTQLLKSANALLARRGPDDSGFLIDDHVVLGHRRLSIIDLSTGHQPMFSDDKSKVIVFNGEIYNFKEIKSGLSQMGHEFKTSSDTEVIIKGYEVFGLEGILSRLEGMFAFALYDKSNQTLFVARDRFGEKPVYYYVGDSGLYFASELKAIVPFLPAQIIDKTALNLFLSLSYIPAPYTIYRSVRKLEAGCVLQVRNASDFFVKPYYSLKDVIQKRQLYSSYESAKSDLRNLLERSVEERMISDVPLGAFLSGGIDSSIISAIMAKKSDSPISTFSIGFKEEAYDESGRAELVAKHIGSQHTLHIVDHNDLLNVADSIVDYFDEPFGDSSALPSWMVAKKSREKVTVVLTGDCADELFGGYEKYLAPYYATRYNSLPGLIRRIVEKTIAVIPHSSYTNHFLRKAKKVIRNSRGSSFDLHYNMMQMAFNDSERSRVLQDQNAVEIKSLIQKYYDEMNISIMDKGFYTDVKVVLEGDMLTKVDRMCMMNSLEARVPYLDSKIVRASFSMPSDYKIQGRNRKRILKDAFSDLLPPEIFQFSKRGFGVPLAQWFRKELRNELESTLSNKSIEEQQIFSYKEVRRLLDEHIQGKENHASKLWCLFVFQKWYSKNVLVGA